jgi:hypothetical protein
MACQSSPPEVTHGELSVLRRRAPGRRRQRRFLWFCIGLALFCAAMIVWLPRSLS